MRQRLVVIGEVVALITVVTLAVAVLVRPGHDRVKHQPIPVPAQSCQGGG